MDAKITALDTRSKIEAQYFDEWARHWQNEELLVRDSFEAPTAVENRYVLSVLGLLEGKRILDLGCGAGEASIYFALKGAKVVSCDISEGFLKIAQKLAQKYKVEIKTLKMRAEELGFGAETFDCVYGYGVLHHVDIMPAIAQVHRVLKEGGSAVFIDPLEYNPIIKIYRLLAKGVRTPTERPMNFRNIKEMENIFEKVEHREFGLCTLLIFIHFFLIRRWLPSKERYWRKLISEGDNYRNAFRILKKIDDFSLNLFPFLKRMCWNTVVILRK